MFPNSLVPLDKCFLILFRYLFPIGECGRHIARNTPGRRCQTPELLTPLQPLHPRDRTHLCIPMFTHRNQFTTVVDQMIPRHTDPMNIVHRIVTPEFVERGHPSTVTENITHTNFLYRFTDSRVHHDRCPRYKTRTGCEKLGYHRGGNRRNRNHHNRGDDRRNRQNQRRNREKQEKQQNLQNENYTNHNNGDNERQLNRVNDQNNIRY